MLHYVSSVRGGSCRCAVPCLAWCAVWVQEASATVPVLMIATTGADPSKDLEEFAGRTVGKAAYSELAMGGGQQVRPPRAHHAHDTLFHLAVR